MLAFKKDFLLHPGTTSYLQSAFVFMQKYHYFYNPYSMFSTISEAVWEFPLRIIGGVTRDLDFGFTDKMPLLLNQVLSSPNDSSDVRHLPP